jgi:hypothetical protein
MLDVYLLIFGMQFIRVQLLSVQSIVEVNAAIQKLGWVSGQSFLSTILVEEKHEKPVETFSLKRGDIYRKAEMKFK